MATINKTSDEAVKKATGKIWSEWVDLIDQEGGEKLTHKEIAKILFDKKYIENGWWCQTVTVGYEYAKGRRKVGETVTQGIEIGARKTMQVGVNDLWDFTFSNEGLKIWLGDIKDFKLEPQFYFQTSEGTRGEIRTIKIGEKIRLIYLPKDFKKPSTLQLYFEDKGSEKSTLGFHQEKLKNLKTREQMKKHWEEVLDEIERRINE